MSPNENHEDTMRDKDSSTTKLSRGLNVKYMFGSLILFSIIWAIIVTTPSISDSYIWWFGGAFILANIISAMIEQDNVYEFPSNSEFKIKLLNELRWEKNKCEEGVYGLMDGKIEIGRTGTIDDEKTGKPKKKIIEFLIKSSTNHIQHYYVVKDKYFNTLDSGIGKYDGQKINTEDEN